jgi:hypothetical protein
VSSFLFVSISFHLFSTQPTLKHPPPTYPSACHNVPTATAQHPHSSANTHQPTMAAAGVRPPPLSPCTALCNCSVWKCIWWLVGYVPDRPARPTALLRDVPHHSYKWFNSASTFTTRRCFDKCTWLSAPPPLPPLQVGDVKMEEVREVTKVDRIGKPANHPFLATCTPCSLNGSVFTFNPQSVAMYWGWMSCSYPLVGGEGGAEHVPLQQSQILQHRSNKQKALTVRGGCEEGNDRLLLMRWHTTRPVGFHIVVWSCTPDRVVLGAPKRAITDACAPIHMESHHLGAGAEVFEGESVCGGSGCCCWASPLQHRCSLLQRSQAQTQHCVGVLYLSNLSPTGRRPLPHTLSLFPPGSSSLLRRTLAHSWPWSG